MSAPAPTPPSHHGFLRSVPVISACTLLSRVLGLVRDVLWTAHFGATAASSAWVVAVTVPNMFRALFGEGAVNSAMVPTFTESLQTHTPDETQKLYAVTFTAMLLVLLAITFVIELALAVAGLIGTYSPENALLIRYTAAMMPYMPLICLAGFFMAVLNAQKHFFAPAFMPAILNVVWIAAILLFARFPVEQAVLYISLSTVLAGFVQVLFQVPFARKRGWRFGLDFDFAYPPFRQIVMLLVPVLIGSGVIEINVLVNRSLAYEVLVNPTLAHLPVHYEGAPACLFFADRLVQLPMAMVGLAISTAVLPALSAHAVRLDMGEFRRTLGSAVRATMFLVIPASIGLIALADPLVEVFFRRGAFDVEAARRTAAVIRLYGVGLWAQSGIFVLLRAFYALKDTKTPVRVSIAAVCLNLALNLSVVWFIGEKGLALSTAVCAMAQFTALFVLLRRRLGRLEGRETLVSAVETLAASLVMGGAAYLAWSFLWPTGAGILARAATLAAIVAAAAGLFVGGAAMLGAGELKRFLRLWSGKV